MPSVMVLNGPNLNLLGTREPDHYGSLTLGDVEKLCRVTAEELGLDIDFQQTNHEGVLIDWIQEAARRETTGIVLNAGAYTHTSVAVADAIKSGDVPVIEVHISNVHAREAVRHHSFISPVAAGVVASFGIAGYRLAIQGLHELVEKTTDRGLANVQR